jgi:phytoene dehydrogenase-like protein
MLPGAEPRRQSRTARVRRYERSGHGNVGRVRRPGTEVDAVVIGAGHNGLVAANVLADAGWDVLVLEATDRPGGAVASGELTAPGFTSDLCSAFYPLGAASPALRALELDRYGLTWRHAPAVLAHLLPDDRCAVLSRDVAETAASVDGFAPGDGAAWRAEADTWRRIGGPLLRAALGPFPPVRAGLRLARAVGVADGVRLARLAALPVRQYVRERFRGDGAALLFAGNALHTDLGPEQAGSAVFGWLLAMLGQDVGFPVPAGGAGRLVDALLARLRARGGRVACGRPVVEVLHARGRAVGVRDADGGTVRARRAVLADVSAPLLYERLVGYRHLPDRLVADLGRFQWDNATVKVDWALDRPVPWTAAGARRAGTVHLGADLDGLTGYAGALATDRLPDEPFTLLGQMTLSDPGRSPAGTETVWAYTHVPQALATDTEACRRQAERMEALVERHAPGFRASVVARHVALPGDLEAHDPGLAGGAINAGTAALHQQLVFRPVPGLARPDTPIDRLYLAGASAHPGGGVHGAPGANAARAALARNGPAGPAYAAAIRALHPQLYD